MNLSKRQEEIINIVTIGEPISSREIAEKIGVTRTAIRADLNLLTVLNILEAKPNVGYFIKDPGERFKDVNELFDIPVRRFMTPPVNLEEEASIHKAIVKMFMVDVGTVYVINNKGKLSGVISRKDLLKMSIGNSDLKNTPVSLAMTRMPNIITIKPEDTFLKAAKEIADNKIDSIPVVENNKVVGRVSKTIINNTLVSFAREKGEGG